MKEVKMEIKKKSMIFQEEGGKWIVPVLIYADDLSFCDESKENVRTIFGRLVEVC